MKEHKQHRGDAVRVGPYEVFAGGTTYLEPQDLFDMDVVVPLTGKLPFVFGQRYTVLAGFLPDFGGVPDNWQEFLEGVVIPELEQGRRIIAFCAASHGRTGTFLASLIALLESAEETPDPILAVRERHCEKAVETLAQAEAIFALREEEVPAQYRSLIV